MSPVVARSARFVWVDSRRLSVVLVVRHWLEVSSLVLLALVVPQMRRSVLAFPVQVQAGRR